MDLIVKGKTQLNLKGMVTTLLRIPFYFIVHVLFFFSLDHWLHNKRTREVLSFNPSQTSPCPLLSELKPKT